MKIIKHFFILTITSTSFVFSTTANSDQVILDDLIVSGGAADSGGNLCVGPDCADLEEFGFDGIKLKANDPLIMFDDTSSSASFPSNDWSLGVTDNAQGGPADFVVKDATADMAVMVLQAGSSGGVALGAGSTVEQNAVSVGATGNERRIMHVADGVNPTDAMNMSQFDAQAAPLNDRIDAINVRITELLDRVGKL